MQKLLILFTLIFSIYSTNSAELIRGAFIKNDNDYIYSFKSPKLEPNKIWLNRVQSISPKMPVWVSEDGNRISIKKGINPS